MIATGESRSGTDVSTLARLPLPSPRATDDIRGLGGLLYAALTGRWPLDTGSGALGAAPTIDGRLATPRQVVPDVGAELSALTMRALYPDQQAGIRSAGELLAGLTRAAGGDTGLLPSAGTTAESHRHGRWLRVGVPVASVLVLGLVVWLVAASTHGPAPHAQTKNPTRPLIVTNPVPTSAASTSPSLTTRPPSRPSRSSASPSATPSKKPSPSATPSKKPRPSKVATAKPLAAVAPAAVAPYNPYGRPPGDDNAGKVGAAADGNPATSWTTDRYLRSPHFGRLKPGTGVSFDLGTPTPLRQVVVIGAIPGEKYVIRAANSPDPDPASMLTMGIQSASSGTVKITNKTPERYWVLWLTSLAPVTGGQFQGGVSEVRFLR